MSDKQIRACYQASYQYEKTQNYDDAIKALLVLRNERSQRYLFNLRLGWLYYLSGKYANAESHYKQATKASPYSIEAKLGHMLVLLARGKYEETETIANQVIRIDRRNYYANLRLAFALRMQRKYDRADGVLSQMLRYYPTDVSFLLEMGLVKFALGERGAAEQHFNKVLQLDPENVTAKEQLRFLKNVLASPTRSIRSRR